MTQEDLFRDKVARKIWERYFRQVEKHTRALASDQKKEIGLEIQDHLFEGFKAEKGENEAERLLNAIEKIGEPEEFLRPMMADYLLSRASRTMNPRTVIKGLYYNLFGGLKKSLVSLLYGVGYLLVIMFGLMALLKVFFPGNVGLIAHESGSMSFGILFDSGPKLGIIFDGTPLKEELLGFWIVPISLLIGTLLYLVLTKKLNLILGKKRGKV